MWSTCSLLRLPDHPHPPHPLQLQPPRPLKSCTLRLIRVIVCFIRCQLSFFLCRNFFLETSRSLLSPARIWSGTRPLTEKLVVFCMALQQDSILHLTMSIPTRLTEQEHIDTKSMLTALDLSRESIKVRAFGGLISLCSFVCGVEKRGKFSGLTRPLINCFSRMPRIGSWAIQMVPRFVFSRRNGRSRTPATRNSNSRSCMCSMTFCTQGMCMAISCVL
jgi:hypothetical protein